MPGFKFRQHHLLPERPGESDLPLCALVFLSVKWADNTTHLIRLLQDEMWKALRGGLALGELSVFLNCLS